MSMIATGIRVMGLGLGMVALWTGVALLVKTIQEPYGDTVLAYKVAGSYLVFGAALLFPWSQLPSRAWRGLLLLLLVLSGVVTFGFRVGAVLYSHAHGGAGTTALLFVLFAGVCFVANVVLCTRLVMQRNVPPLVTLGGRAAWAFIPHLSQADIMLERRCGRWSGAVPVIVRVSIGFAFFLSG